MAPKRGREKLCVAFLWHQHQPVYRMRRGGPAKGAYLLPWVRLHAVRDYYSMAALVSEFPNVHLTINLVPALLWQLEDYLENGATDLWMEWSLTPTAKLSSIERDLIVSRFFDANWKNEVRIYPRYEELLDKRRKGLRFSDRDITDLRMWFNLAWFPPECRHTPLELHDGSKVSVSRFISKGRDFDEGEIGEVIDEQYKLMRNVLPLHQRLVESGQIEVSVTPFYHPILPLIVDTDLATIDAEGATLPERFSHPEDARAQIEKAVAFYTERFGRPPAGMWPSEGSVGEHMVGHVADAGFRWMATDRGVLEKSGKWGYETEDPEILLRPYVAGEPGRQVSVFFRHTRLSDDIGFSLQDYADYDRAARDYTSWFKVGFARRVKSPAQRVLTIVVDGENAWGSYRNDGRGFLRGLYRRLEDDPELVSVTFSEFIDGNPERGVAPHPVAKQHRVRPLYTASWIDEMGSPHGNDLNIWIGSPAENRAWNLLGAVRRHLDDVGATPATHPEAFESIYIAEGSDWFWWFGDDFVLPTGVDSMFDELFREHLKDVYRQLGEEPPAALDEPIARGRAVWSKDDPVRTIGPSQRMRIVSPASGVVRWSVDGWRTSRETRLEPAGDVMGQFSGYVAALGPFGPGAKRVDFAIVTPEGEERHFVRIARPAPAAG